MLTWQSALASFVKRPFFFSAMPLQGASNKHWGHERASDFVFGGDGSVVQLLFLAVVYVVYEIARKASCCRLLGKSRGDKGANQLMTEICRRLRFLRIDLH